MSKRRTVPKAKVELFPFLAVLICTIGSLVFLLLLVSRQAHAYAVRRAELEASQQQPAPPEPEPPALAEVAAPPAVEPSPPAAPVPDAEAEAKLAELQEQIEGLRLKQGQIEAELAKRRLQLGHVEDSLRNMERELESLIAAEAQLEKLRQSKGLERSQWEQKLAELQAVLAEKDQALKEARDAIQKRGNSFAIVPYDGPYKTNRIPFYLECKNDGVYLQPQGIHLTAKDFEGGMGAGNPLAAAIRGMSEYIVVQGTAGNVPLGRPYPLMLVRPDGILAYYAARDALKEWDAEFGYELIGADWPLAFPPVDPALTTIAQQAIQDARKRQEWLLKNAPRMNRGNGGSGNLANANSSSSKFRVGPGRVGVVDENGSPGYGGYDRNGSGNGSSPYGRSGPDGQGSGGAQGNGQQGSGQLGSGQQGTGQLGLGGGSEGEEYGQPGGPNGRPGGQPGEQPGMLHDVALGNPNPGAPGEPRGSGEQAGSGGGSGGGYGQEQNNSGSQSGGQSGGGSQAGSPGGSLSHGSSRRSPGGNSGGSSAGSPGSSATMGNPSIEAPRRGELVESIARNRGVNWAVTRQKPNAIGVQKPVRIVLHGDYAQVLPNGRPRPFNGPTDNIVDGLMQDVDRQVDAWGVAGKEMYWKPNLNFEVHHEAKDRYQELQQLLQNSGLEMQATYPVVRLPKPAR